MAKWTGFYKIVEPKPRVTKVTDNQSIGDQGAYGNFSWYQRLVQGSASRLTRYREYDLMDNDVEVARALDTIAEEMTGNNPKTDEPLLVVIDAEKEEEISSRTVLTLKTALKYWNSIHGWEFKLFNVSRTMIKYGDCFFKKNPKNLHEKWKYIHSKNVVGALVDEEDVTKVLGWQMRTGTKKAKSSYGVPVSQTASDVETELVPAEEVVRFTLNDDMSDGAPFGDSVLGPAYKAHKQKELLEDAVIIYRIQRAPERRVFYIDVGTMPPQRVKTYLEQIKNEIKQKKIPNIHGGQQDVDSVYNPQSMCLALDTKIPLLDGRTLTLNQIIEEYKQGKELWAYSINPENGEMVPGPISWAGETRKNAETIVLTLDNGKTITCTPDHKFPVQGKGFERVQAKDLTPSDSLWPFTMKKDHMFTERGKTKGKYARIYNPGTKGWRFVHRLVSNYMRNINEHNELVFNGKYSEYDKKTIHHIDYNSLNNSPNNLAFMNNADHAEFHKSLDINQEIKFSGLLFERFEQIANEDLNIKFKDLLNRLNNDALFMNVYENLNQPIKRTSKIKTSEFRQKIFLKFMKHFGYKNWRDYKKAQIQNAIDVNEFTNQIKTPHIKLLQFFINLIKTVTVFNNGLVEYLKKHDDVWKEFVNLYNATKDNSLAGQYQELSVPESGVFDRTAKMFGYNNFKHLVDEAHLFNHRVVKIEKGVVQNTGTLTIDKEEKYHNYHNFALDCGVITSNSEDFFLAQRSDSKGSRIETLPGGQGLGELSDLEYFQQKVWMGLRVPTTYMTGGTEGAVFNDGKVGVAYIQELRFSLYIERLQGYIESILDREFKNYLRRSDIRIDESIYRIRLPSPTNFGTYRQQEVDAALLGSFGTADAIPYLAKRFILSRYLHLEDAEIISNERMLREEKGMDPDGTNKEDIPELYVGAAEAAAGMGAAGAAGMAPAGDMGGMTAEEGGAEGAEGGTEAGGATELETT